MIIFSGIQPTGRKHLGNYIGAIRQYVEGQDRGDPAIFCIVDLHAISVPYDPAELRERVHDTTAILLAAGLDPERCVLFRQSDVREHTELTWLLSAVTAHGDLNRMTQFKEKSAQQRELVSAALFYYPVLQAADILAYGADEVPVGEDQRQHVELPREIARRFNERFGGEPGRAGAARARGRRPDHGPAGARAEDVHDLLHRGGHDPRARGARGDPQEARRRGHRFGARDRPRRGQGRDREPDRNPRRRPRHRARRRSKRSSTAPGTASSRPRSPTGWSSCWPRSASATRSCAPTRRRWSGRSAPAPRRRARSPRSTLAEVRDRMGIGPPR